MKSSSFLAALTLAALVFGQPSAGDRKVTFEVASVHPSADRPGARMRMSGDAGRIDWANLPLKTIVGVAYGMKQHQISGPDWMDSQTYNIDAKFPAGSSRAQMPAMLQSLLAERFKLTTHREQRIVPVYELIARKGPTKLRGGDQKTPLRYMGGSGGRHVAGSGTLDELAKMLSNWLDRPLLNKTSIEGVYDFDLQWTGFEYENAGRGGAERFDGVAVSYDVDHATIFSEIRDKTGLQLRSGKGPVEFLIVDHAEMMPAAN